MVVLPAEISTARLVLRWWDVADATALVEAVAANLDHLRPWMPWIAAEPVGAAERAELIRRWREEAAAGGDATYGVFLDGAVVGGAGLHRRRGPGVLEIGYWVHVAHTRRGYATELARALTDVAFADPAIHHVEIHHDRANAASGAVPRALGYRLFLEQRRERQAPAESGLVHGWRIDRAHWTR